MASSSRLRILAVVGVAAFAFPSLLAACSDDGGSTPAPSADAGRDATTKDGGGGGGDEPTPDAGPDAADEVTHIDGPNVEGETCEFNRDCKLALRCECDETEGTCACTPGERGDAKLGETCTNNESCMSAMCANGDNGSHCSDSCNKDEDCPATLPRCIPVIGIYDPICAPPAAQ